MKGVFVNAMAAGVLLTAAAGSVARAETCGPVTCSDGQECCNASCGICASPGDACIMIACEPCGKTICAPGLQCCNPLDGICVQPGMECTLGALGGEPCNHVVCGPREYCCNYSCSICAPFPDGACTMQVCEETI